MKRVSHLRKEAQEQQHPIMLLTGFLLLMVLVTAFVTPRKLYNPLLGIETTYAAEQSNDLIISVEQAVATPSAEYEGDRDKKCIADGGDPVAEKGGFVCYPKAME